MRQYSSTRGGTAHSIAASWLRRTGQGKIGGTVNTLDAFETRARPTLTMRASGSIEQVLMKMNYKYLHPHIAVPGVNRWL